MKFCIQLLAEFAVIDADQVHLLIPMEFLALAVGKATILCSNLVIVLLHKEVIFSWVTIFSFLPYNLIYLSLAVQSNSIITN